MSMATEILTLRNNQMSSVEILLGAIDWQNAAQDDDHFLSRGYDVTVAADLVLLNVAVYAAEALSEPPKIRRTRSTLLPFRRKRHGSDAGQLRQRTLFA